MKKTLIFIVYALLALSPVMGEETKEKGVEQERVEQSGVSVVGNTNLIKEIFKEGCKNQVETETTSFSTKDGIAALILFAFPLLFSLFMLVTMWRIFTRANQPGWGSLIPIYNTYLLVKIANKPGWWLILLMIPVVNVILSALILAGISTTFGKGLGFTIGLILLPFIFYPILAFEKTSDPKNGSSKKIVLSILLVFLIATGAILYASYFLVMEKLSTAQTSHSEQINTRFIRTKKQTFCLHGTKTGGTPRAMINSKIYQVGDEIDGLRVLSIEASNAVLEYNGEQHTINVGQTVTF